MSPRRTPSRRALAIVAAVGLVVLGAAGALWWLTRSDPPPPLSVDALVDDDAAEPDATSVELDGTWEVDPDGESEAGLRIEEERFGGLPDNTAVGRTPMVTGSLTVADSQVTDARFEVDLSTLEFTDDPGIPVAGRSAYLRTRSLETDRFPTAAFELAAPVDLADLDPSTTTAVAVEGDLTLHGVTRPVTFDVDVRGTADRFVLGTAAPVPVRLADHDIEVPEISGVSEVADVGQFEFVVVLRPPP